jgi:hypothetical protein
MCACFVRPACGGGELWPFAHDCPCCISCTWPRLHRTHPCLGGPLPCSKHLQPFTPLASTPRNQIGARTVRPLSGRTAHSTIARLGASRTTSGISQHRGCPPAPALLDAAHALGVTRQLWGPLRTPVRTAGHYHVPASEPIPRVRPALKLVITTASPLRVSPVWIFYTVLLFPASCTLSCLSHLART